jgi:hypothetical protein
VGGGRLLRLSAGASRSKSAQQQRHWSEPPGQLQAARSGDTALGQGHCCLSGLVLGPIAGSDRSIACAAAAAAAGDTVESTRASAPRTKFGSGSRDQANRLYISSEHEKCQVRDGCEWLSRRGLRQGSRGGWGQCARDGQRARGSRSSSGSSARCHPQWWMAARAWVRSSLPS